MQVERLRTRAALDALQPEWDALWASAPDRTPFQSSAWLLPWYDVFGGGAPCVFAVRAGGALIGLAPFYTQPGQNGEELRLLGAGLSDYLDAIVAPGARHAVAAALDEALRDAAGEWVFCGLDHLPPESVLRLIALPSGMREARADDEPCPVMTLPRRPADLPAALGTRLAKNIRNARSRAARSGQVRVERAGRETLDDSLAALFTIHGARWQARGGPGVLADPDVRRFHREAAPRLLEAGLLRLFVLRLDERPVAVLYGLCAAGRGYYYIGGFEPGAAHASPGVLLLAHAVEALIAEGASTFDFLAGREDYKYRWGAVDRPRASRHFIRAGGRQG